MAEGPKIAQIASLIGEPARANMLVSLLDGRALTASELAYVAGIAPQTASGHLAKLCDAGLLALEKQGRHRYFRLASPLVGQMLEGVMVVAEAGPARYQPHWRRGDALRNARTCYDHMAGRLAVDITDRLIERSFIVLEEDAGRLTEAGEAFFGGIGLSLASASTRRVFCRPCLDWSERRPHLAGQIGATVLRHALDRGWVQRVKDSRALTITPSGRRQLPEIFGVAMPL
jgi:DNA-binding transcriptional ArsR family regulator